MKAKFVTLLLSMFFGFVSVSALAEHHEGDGAKKPEQKHKPHSHPADKGTSPAAPANENATDKSLNKDQEQEKKHNHQRDAK